MELRLELELELWLGLALELELEAAVGLELSPELPVPLLLDLLKIHFYTLSSATTRPENVGKIWNGRRPRPGASFFTPGGGNLAIF